MEFVRFDSIVASTVLSLFYMIKILVVQVVFGQQRSLRTAGSLFRHTKLEWARSLSALLLRRGMAARGAEEMGHAFLSMSSDRVDSTILARLRQEILAGKRGLFDKRLLILSPPENGRKGVLLIKFTEYFKYFLTVFDMDIISSKYILVAEPSFSGYFDEDILCLLAAKTQVIVQCPEPVDFNFTDGLSANLYPTCVGANCWVDPRIFFPIHTEKMFDIVVVSIWSNFKRHYHLFKSLSRMRRRQLKVALVGKPWPKTLEDIRQEASYYGVLSQLTFFEGISQAELNVLLNRSKSYLLLSKKEGINKSVMEALLSGVPVFLLQGLNYGHHYAYVNKATGGFINPRRLADFLDHHAEALPRGPIPQDSILAKYSPQTSTEKLVEAIQSIEKACSVKVNKELALKVNNPDLDYYDVEHWEKYQRYYCELAQSVRAAIS